MQQYRTRILLGLMAFFISFSTIAFANVVRLETKSIIPTVMAEMPCHAVQDETIQMDQGCHDDQQQYCDDCMQLHCQNSLLVASPQLAAQHLFSFSNAPNFFQLIAEPMQRQHVLFRPPQL